MASLFIADIDFNLENVLMFSFAHRYRYAMAGGGGSLLVIEKSLLVFSWYV